MKSKKYNIDYGGKRTSFTLSFLVSSLLESHCLEVETDVREFFQNSLDKIDYGDGVGLSILFEYIVIKQVMYDVAGDDSLVHKYLQQWEK